MIKTNPLFKNPALQSAFEEDGFVKVPLLNETQVAELVALFNDTRQQHSTVSNLHHTTTDTQNPDLIYKVDTKIKSVFTAELEKILIDFKALVGCMHIKESGNRSETGIHQDPTFVDESKYCSANVWVALHDIDESNGNLFFVKGSNRVTTSLRITPSFPPYYNSFQSELPAMATHVPLKKGEAVIFNNATIHGATENLSNDVRLASTLLVCSAQADWLLYYKEEAVPDSKIEEYKLTLDTFVALTKSGRPDSKAFTQYVSSDFPQLSKADFLKKVGGSTSENGNYLQKLKSIFGLKATA